MSNKKNTDGYFNLVLPHDFKWAEPKKNEILLLKSILFPKLLVAQYMQMKWIGSLN